jgi:hypothetical protein
VIEIAIDGGGTLRVDRFDGEHGEGRSQRPFPPGSRLGGAFEGAPVRLKVSACRRDEDAFRVRFRLVDLSRGLREKILAGIAQPAQGPGR